MFVSSPPIFLNLQNYREQCTKQSTLSEARELPVNGKAKWKHISKKTEAIQAWVSQAHVTDMNVNLSRPSCLYSDPSVYVKTEYDATGKVTFTNSKSNLMILLAIIFLFIAQKVCF